MNGMSHKATGISGLPLAILLSLSMMSGAWAADAPLTATSAQPALAQDEELAEILVRGKSLSREISDAEDAFYAVYNKVNRNSSFSITCGEMSLHPGSMIMRRACLPGFIVDAYRGSRAGYGAYPRTTYSSCNTSGGWDQNGVPFSLSNTSCGGSWSVNIPSYMPPSPQALIAAHSKDMAVHMMMLINRDPQLQQMAGRLDDLYLEFNSMKTRYERIRPPDEKPARIHRGPRVL